MTQSASDLPPLYARWVREFLGSEPAPETRATCLDCAMAPPPEATDADGVIYFKPTNKCCTYLPTLPNFLAGAILADPSPENAHGRRSLVERIAAREKVTPLGVDRPAAVEAVYQVLAPTSFGVNESMRCPHLTDDQLCGIWRHRNAACATWFCKHERGAVGERFWDHLRWWLRTIEQELASWCVLEAGWDAEDLADLFPVDMPLGTDVRRLVSRPEPRGWGAWEGREVEFYEACARRVADLSWDDVARVCGSSATARGTVVTEMFGRLQSADVPAVLVQGPLIVLRRREASAVVLTYRRSDPLELSNDALRVLERFDGRPTPDVLRGLVARTELADRHLGAVLAAAADTRPPFGDQVEGLHRIAFGHEHVAGLEGRLDEARAYERLQVVRQVPQQEDVVGHVSHGGEIDITGRAQGLESFGARGARTHGAS